MRTFWKTVFSSSLLRSYLKSLCYFDNLQATLHLYYEQCHFCGLFWQFIGNIYAPPRFTTFRSRMDFGRPRINMYDIIPKVNLPFVYCKVLPQDPVLPWCRVGCFFLTFCVRQPTTRNEKKNVKRYDFMGTFCNMVPYYF